MPRSRQILSRQRITAVTRISVRQQLADQPLIWAKSGTPMCEAWVWSAECTEIAQRPTPSPRRAEPRGPRPEKAPQRVTTKPSPRTRLIAIPAIAAIVLASGCAEGESSEDVAASLASMSASAPKSLSLDESGRQENLSSHRLAPVYWTGPVDGTERLYREFVQADDAGDPITTSLRYMMANAPFDRDYGSVWTAETSIGTSVADDNTITVDVGSRAFATDVTPEQAELAVQQLVYTATAAAWTSGLLTEGTAPSVRLLIDGRTDLQAFGHVDLDRRLVRDAALRAPIWIIDPQYGTSRTAGKVTLKGVAEPYEGGLRWEVVEASSPDKPVSAGTFAQNEANDEGFSASLTLGPGIYEVSVWGVDAEGARRGLDTKHFTVTDG